jgi:hypothetical protein
MPEHKLIVHMGFGSHVYGTNVPTSDKDFKGVALPSGRDIVLQRAFNSINESTSTDATRNTQDDVDSEIYSFHSYLKHLMDGQTVALDMLFTPRSHYAGVDNWHWHKIQHYKDRWLHKGTSAFAGYCQAQAAKYSVKGSYVAAYRLAMDFFKHQSTTIRLEHVRTAIDLELVSVANREQHLHDKKGPTIKFVYLENNQGQMEEYLQVGPKTKVPMKANCHLAYQIYKGQFDKYGQRAKQAETNQGIDWKALMHAVRVCEEAKELLLTHQITFPRPEKDILLKIRKGELTYKQVEELIVNGLDELTAAKEESTLPEEPDRKFAEELIYATYKDLVQKS